MPPGLESGEGLWGPWGQAGGRVAGQDRVDITQWPSILMGLQYCSIRPNFLHIHSDISVTLGLGPKEMKSDIHTIPSVQTCLLMPTNCFLIHESHISKGLDKGDTFLLEGWWVRSREKKLGVCWSHPLLSSCLSPPLHTQGVPRHGPQHHDTLGWIRYSPDLPQSLIIPTILLSAFW